MATYDSPSMASGVQPRGDIGLTSVFGTFTQTAAFATSDVVRLARLPKGAVLIDILLHAPDELDTHATPTLAFDIGLAGGDQDLWGDNSTTNFGQNTNQTHGLFLTGLTVANQPGFLYEFTEDGIIQLTITTGAATGTTDKTIQYSILYTMAQ